MQNSPDNSPDNPLDNTEEGRKQSRKHVRHELVRPIPVTDSSNGKSLGALVNLTVEGLMVMGNEAWETNRIYQISLALPEPVDGCLKIELGVDCLWTRGEEQYGKYWSGFQIIDASHQAIKIIETLIRDFGEAPAEAS